MLMFKKFVAFVRVLLRRFPRLLFSLAILSVFSAFVGSASIFSLAPIFDLFLNTTEVGGSGAGITQYFLTVFQVLGIPPTLPYFLLVFLAITIVKNGFLLFTTYYIARTQFGVMKTLVNETYTQCFHAKWHFFILNNPGTLLNTFNEEINSVGMAFVMIGRLFSQSIQALFYVVIPFIICWQATVVCIIMLAVLSLPLQYLTKIGYRIGQESTSSRNGYMSVLQETLSAAKLILGFGNQDRHIKEVNRRFYRYRTAMVKSKTLVGAIRSLYEPIFLGTLLLVIYMIVRWFSISVSEVLVMFYAFQSLKPLFGQMNSEYHEVLNRLPSYEQVIHLQNLAKQQRQRTGTQDFEALETACVFENVTFAYPDHEPVLHDISLNIPKGKMIALVGESGTGKTTLLDLIARFYEPTQGEILLDNIPLREYNIDSYRQQISFVPQDSLLFNLSIRENLTWSAEKATQNEIERACKLANIYNFIMGLPEGFETVVGDRGVRLSVGQRQRISLARAIIRNPQLLLLDEATSALDSESERLIQKSIEDIAKETTIVVIAHRLSTITGADYIYVLDKGRVVEEGTFEELIAKQNIFYRMVELQKL